MKGSSVHEEVSAASEALRKYGAGAVSVSEYSTTGFDPHTTVLRVEATRPSQLRLSSSRRQGHKKRR